MGNISTPMPLIFCAYLGISLGCFAETWTVDDDGKADFSSIQDAIDASSNGDFIDVQPGIYFESLNFLGKGIRVQGVDATTTIVDGSNNVASVVTFNSGETNQSVLSKLTIRGGQGNYWADPIFGQQRCGGGIYCEDSSPTIQLSVIENNSAWGGGGMFVTNGNPFIMFSDFLNNDAVGHGGGLYLNGNVYALIDSLDVKFNTATWGAGMTCMGNSEPEILNCAFDENTALNIGGGMYIRSSSSPSVVACTFNNNLQTDNPLGSGGGVCIYGAGTGGGPCYPFFRFCYFVGNTVNGDGGGMSAAYDSHPKLEDCYFALNQAGRSGGGLACVADADYMYPSNADISDVTIENNHANEEGGGIHVRYSNPVINWVDVRNNVAENLGGGINFFESQDASLQNSQVCGNETGQIAGEYLDIGGNTISNNCAYCEGDINGDAIVDVADLLAVVGTWGPCVPCTTDIDGNGVVNVLDLLLVVGNWGNCN